MSLDVQELFSRDPRKLSAQDLDSIILHMRRMRENYQAKPAPAPRAKPAAKTSKPTIDIDLSDLGL